MTKPLAAPPESPWTKVAVSFGSLMAASVGGGAAFDCAVELIRAIEGTQDAQTALLNAIYEDVELLRLQAFRSGKLRLEEVATVGLQSDRSKILLNEAAERFYDAEPMCSSQEESAINELYLGITFGLLDSREDASRWLRKSAASGSDAARRLAEAGNIKVMSKKKAIFLLGAYAAPYFLVKNRKKKLGAQGAAEALVDLLPFVNAAASCHNALGVEDSMPGLQLIPTGKNKWALEETEC